MANNYEAQIQQAIPAEFHMISGSDDSQTSADVSNVGKFQLPNPAGRAGGACTSALLQVLYRDGHVAGNMTWVQLLRQMRSELLNMGFDQVPQLTSSRLIDVNKTMYIIPPGSTGRRRAVLIGINYVGQQGQLSGCHNDMRNIKNYLIKAQGFNESEMLILCDDGRAHAPTRKNILDAFRRITEYSQAGDVVFIHYSGHGSRVRDYSGDEDDGYDETIMVSLLAVLIAASAITSAIARASFLTLSLRFSFRYTHPVDFKTAGQIVDDDILKILVKPMRAGVNVTVLMDCCYSGTVLDLPYRFSADDSKMRLNQGFNINSVMGAPGAIACCACLALLLLSDLG